jgi:hypothetical protein
VQDKRKVKNWVLIKNQEKFQKQVAKGKNPGLLLAKRARKVFKQGHKWSPESTVQFSTGSAWKPVKVGEWMGSNPDIPGIMAEYAGGMANSKFGGSQWEAWAKKDRWSNPR